MTTIAVFGGTGYAGGAIVAEARRRGHSVISVARTVPDADGSGLDVRPGSLHDAALVETLGTEAEVFVVAIPARDMGGVKLIDALPSLSRASEEQHVRLGFVGGAGSLQVSEGGPRIVDAPDFPDAYKPEALNQADVLDALRDTPDGVDWFYVSPAATFGAHAPGTATGHYREGGDVLVAGSDGVSAISGADFALAFVDEIERHNHRRARFTVAY